MRSGMDAKDNADSDKDEGSWIDGEYSLVVDESVEDRGECHWGRENVDEIEMDREC